MHHIQEVTELLAWAWIVVLLLPSYNPDPNPIETEFTVVNKQYLKKPEQQLQILREPGDLY